MESSLEVYIQEAVSHLCVAELSDCLYHGTVSFVAVGEAQLCVPPSLPWGHYFSRSQQ